MQTLVQFPKASFRHAIAMAGKLIGITVLDHIIHGDGTGEVLSIREH